MAIEQYPHWADDETKVLWLQKLPNAILETAMTFGGGGGSTTPTSNVEIVDGRVTVDDVTIQFRERYLHLRFSENATGTMVINDLTNYSGSSLFVGTFNSDSTTLPSSPNFVYQEFPWSVSHELYTNNIGGGSVLFLAQTTNPGTDWVEQTTGPVFIDLTTGIVTVVNGLNTRLDVAYSDNSTGTLNFTADEALAGERIYIGQRRVSWREGATVPAISTNASLYAWTRVRGNQGLQGRFPVRAYFVAADGTTTPGTPTGGTITGGALTTAPTGTPNTQTWVTSIPATAGTQVLWIAEFEYDPTNTAANIVWSPPFQSGGTGPAGRGIQSVTRVGTTVTVTYSSGDPDTFTVEDGDTGAAGAAGLSIFEALIFRRSATALTTPTGGSFNFTTNVLTAPTDWSTSVPAGTDPVYVSNAIFSVQGTTGTDTTTTWALPTIFARDGNTGGAGASGRSVFQAKIFRRSATALTAPTGGSFNFTDNTLTAPTDWSTSVPSGTDPVYSTTALFSVLGNTGTDTTTTWATPEIEARDGETGPRGVSTAFIYARSTPVPTTRPATNFNLVDAGFRFQGAGDPGLPEIVDFPVTLNQQRFFLQYTITAMTSDGTSYSGTQADAIAAGQASSGAFVDATGLTGLATAFNNALAAGATRASVTNEWLATATGTGIAFTSTVNSPYPMPEITITEQDDFGGRVTISAPTVSQTGTLPTPGIFDQTESNGWYVTEDIVPTGDGRIWSRSATSTGENIEPSNWRAATPFQGVDGNQGDTGDTGAAGANAFTSLLTTDNGIVFEQSSVDCNWNITPVNDVITSVLTIVTNQGPAVFARDVYNITYNTATAAFAITASTNNVGDVAATQLIVSGTQAETTFTVSITTQNSDGATVLEDAVEFISIPGQPKRATGALYLVTGITPLPPTDQVAGAQTTFNFDTNVITSPPTDGPSGLTWSNTETPVVARDSTQYWTVPYIITEATCGGTVSITYGAVRNVIDFDGIVRFIGTGNSISDGTNTTTPLTSGDDISVLINDAGYATEAQIAEELATRDGDITIIDGGLIQTGTINAEKINVDNLIDIEDQGGAIASGLQEYPRNLAQVPGSGFWLGVDTDGLPKLFLGRSDNHLAWDGNSLQLAGRVLTDSNILSVDGDIVSTRTFRTIQDDYIDNSTGAITGATLGNVDMLPTAGSATGTGGTTNIRYVFAVNVVSDPTVAQQPGNVLLGRHYYIELTTTNDNIYNIGAGNVVLCIGSTDAGNDITMYVDGGTTGFYAGDPATTGTRSEAQRPIVAGTASNFMYADRESFAYPIRRTITFETLGRHELTLELIATAGVIPGWTRLALEAFATGVEDIRTISATTAGVQIDTTEFESVENVQVTASANTNAWYTGLPPANALGVRDTDAINIHSATNAECSVIIRGY